jgi:integrase
MKGHIRRRGAQSWQLKLDIGHDAHGKRLTEFHTVRGSKKDAQTKLAELVAAVGKGAHVPRSSLTVGEYVTERIEQWLTLGAISPLTAEGYRRLLRCQIADRIGAIALQDLRPADIEKWHAALKASGRRDGQGGLSPLTIRHAHRLLSKALKQAQRFDLIVRNPLVGEAPPRVVREEVEILSREEARAVVARLKGHPIYAKAIVALFGGLRRSEILALRWGAVDLERKRVSVREALEETVAGGLVFKDPKSKAGKRDVSLPEVVVDALREHRRRQAELWFKLGQGRLTDDVLVFGRLDGGPASPRALSKEWRLAAASIGIKATFHALRHTHVSHLIDSGVDVVKISRRVGHADIATTLNVYAHLFDAREDRSAAAINEAVATLLKP